MKRFLWSYKLNNLSNQQLIEFKNNLITNFGITDIFLSMGGSLNPQKLDENRLKYIIEKLSPINVHAMILQDNFYIDLTDKIKRKIQQELSVLSNYNLKYPKHRLKGIHIDVEPHTRKDYQSGNEIIVFQKYIELSKFLHNEIKSKYFTSKEFMFSAATGWRYEFRDDVKIEKIVKFLDAIVPMAYNSKEEPVCGSFSRIINRLPFEQWQNDYLSSLQGF